MIIHTRSAIVIAIHFEPRDLWIGVYWRRYKEGGRRFLELYICILPTLPLHIHIKLPRQKGE